MNSHSPPAGPFRWRFSLGTLILVSALIVAVISHVRTSRRLELHRNQSYALEVGLLDRIYARQLPYTSYDVWQWKVYIPESGRYRINLATQDIGRTGLAPAQQHWRIEFQGEVVVTVLKHQIDDHRKSNGVSLRVTQRRNTREINTQVVPYNILGGTFERSAGQDGSESFDRHQPVVLLRGNYSDFVDEPASSGSSVPPGIGILVWIEPIGGGKHASQPAP